MFMNLLLATDLFFKKGMGIKNLQLMGEIVKEINENGIDLKDEYLVILLNEYTKEWNKCKSIVPGYSAYFWCGPKLHRYIRNQYSNFVVPEWL